MLEYPPIRVPRQAEGLAADVGEDSGGDALGASAPLIFMDLIPDQQVEEALHVVLHVVGQRVAGGAGLVGLPEGRAAAGARCACGGSGPRP